MDAPGCAVNGGSSAPSGEECDQPWQLSFTALAADVQGEGGPVRALRGVSGGCGRGEVLLVTGPPGSGCAELLRALAGAPGVSVVGGRVDISGHSGGGEHHAALLCAEDCHLAHLTVDQTLLFAAGLGGAPDAAAERAAWAAAAFGLAAAGGTQVGSLLRRGISGGERRRLSIAECLLALPRSTSVLCLEEWCDGLDGATAARLGRLLSSAARARGLCVVAAVRQPCAQLLESADRLLVLEQGQGAYFGPPRASALPSPPGSPRAAPEGEQCPELPSPPAARDSDAGVAPPPLGRPERAAPPSQQMRWLLWRELAVAAAAPLQFVAARLARYLLQAAALGVLFFRLGRDQHGAYNRMGLLFACMMTLSLGTLALMPDAIEQRAVYRRQAAAGLFRGPLWIVAKALADAPLCAVETLVVTAVVYPLTGLRSEPDRIVCFYATLCALALACGAVVRLFVLAARDLMAAQVGAGAVLVVLIFFCGFPLRRDSIPAWWRWLHWLSPFTYGYDALVVNEYSGLALHCAPTETVPPSAVSAACSRALSSVCTAFQGRLHDCGECAWRHRGELESRGCDVAQAESWCLGDAPGYCPPPWTTGEGYADSRLGISVGGSDLHRRWLDLAVLLLAAAVLTAAAAAASSWATAGRPPRGWGRRGDEQGAGAGEEAGSADEDLLLPGAAAKPAPGAVSWRQLQYSVGGPHGPGTAPILHSTDGCCRPGRLLALLGPTGAGKTTLLDALAGRKTAGVLLGAVELDGTPVAPPEWRRAVGYVEQDPRHLPIDTVLSAMEFSARLRGGEPPAAARRTAAALAARLGLSGVGHRRVGPAAGSGGLPGDARRLLSLGVELAAQTPVLFCDEPTTGLDTEGALRVAAALRAAADSGRAVVCSMHRPSAAVFAHFDDMLVLAQGRQLYCGPVPGFIPYLESHGADASALSGGPAAAALAVGAADCGRPVIRRPLPEPRAPEAVQLPGARFALQRGGGLTCTRGGGGGAAVSLLAYDEAERRLFADPPLPGGAVLPMEGLEEILGGLRALAERAGVQHNIPEAVAVPHAGEWRGDAKRCWCSRAHRPDGTLCAHGAEIIRRGHWSCCGAAAGEPCAAPGPYAWAKAWQADPAARKLRTLLRDAAGSGSPPGAAPALARPRPAALPTLARRRLRLYARTPTYCSARLAFSALGALLFGSTFWQIGDTQRDLQSYTALVATTASTGVVFALGAAAPLIDERPVVCREISSGTYSGAAYAASCLAVEAPLAACCALLWAALTQGLCGLPEQSFGFVLLAYSLLAVCMSAVGLVVAALAPSLMVAEIVIPVLHMVWSLHCGFLVLRSNIPTAMKVFEVLNPYTYFVRSCAATLLRDHGLFRCNEEEYIHLPGKLCDETFVVTTVTRTLTPGTATATVTPTGNATCPICPVTVPDTFLSFYDWHYASRWSDLGGLCACTAVCAAAFALVASPAKHEVR